MGKGWNREVEPQLGWGKEGEISAQLDISQWGRNKEVCHCLQL